MINNNFIWLLKWYYGQCDGYWEHDNGIEILTLDNSRWFLRICLDETELQDKEFQKICVNRSEHDWIRCYIEHNIFIGAGGPLNLPEILEIFRKWAQCENQRMEECNKKYIAPKKNDVY
jgi:hypothetical protein